MFQIDHAKEFARLPNAPIVEAMIHLVAPPSLPWNQENLRKELTEKFRKYDLKTIHLLEANVEVGSPEKNVEMQQGWGGFRMTSADGKCVSQFTLDSVIFSRLAPYQGWEQFVASAQASWDVYLELANPLSIDRIGVRFISKIDLQENESAQDFVDATPSTLAAIGLIAESFFHKETFLTPGHPFAVNLTRAIQLQEPPLPRRTLIVDIDVTTTEPSFRNELKTRLQDMRFIKNEVFFAFMRDTVKRFS